MATGKSGFWQVFTDGYRDGQALAKAAPSDSTKSKAEVLYQGVVDEAGTRVTIYRNGTFTIKRFLGGTTVPERLIAIEYDADSMRRKSASGRGAVALMTGGFSLAASNNRGVAYLTVTGESSGVQTFTAENPSDKLLSDLRSLKAAGVSVVSQHTPTHEEAPAASVDLSEQLERLAELRRTGALTEDEFAAAKARLLL